MEKYLDKLDWYNVSRYQRLTEAFIDKHKDKIVWKEIFKSQPHLSKKFFNKYKFYYEDF